MVTKENWKTIIKDWHEKNFPNLIDREIEIPFELKIKRVFSLIGPRRAGKTSEMMLIAKKISEKYGKEKTIYINFERADLGILNSENLVEIIESYQEMFPETKKESLWLFLDEIQNVENWEKFVRTCIDEEIKVFITGSSSKLLSKEIATTMRGRNLSYHIYPLSFKEFLKFKKYEIPKILSSKEKSQIKNYFQEYLAYGGYPEAVLFPSEKEKILRDIFDTAIIRDVIDRHKIRNDNLVKILVKALLTSKEFSTSKFYNYVKSQNMKISKDSIYKYVGYLEDAFFVFLLNKFNFSYKKTEQTLPKVYFIDNGLLKISSIDDKGRLLENLVFTELLRRNLDFAYYQNILKEEVDFLIKEGKKVKELIQVCFGVDEFQTKEREIKSLIYAGKEFNCNKLIILTNDVEKEELYKNKKIIIKPVWKWLLEN